MEQWPALFVEYLVFRLLFKLIVPSTDKIHEEVFPEAVFLERLIFYRQKKSAKKCFSKLSQVLIKFISKAFPNALQKEQWAASSPFVVQHTRVFYQKNVNENFIFKWSVRGTA